MFCCPRGSWCANPVLGVWEGLWASALSAAAKQLHPFLKEKGSHWKICVFLRPQTDVGRAQAA